TLEDICGTRLTPVIIIPVCTNNSVVTGDCYGDPEAVTRSTVGGLHFGAGVICGYNIHQVSEFQHRLGLCRCLPSMLNVAVNMEVTIGVDGARPFQHTWAAVAFQAMRAELLVACVEGQIGFRR